MVYILGYPREIAVSDAYLLWKRGTVASEPAFDLDGKPKLLVAATREGMSESPVCLDSPLNPGEIEATADLVHDNQPWYVQPKYFVIGIYSTRTGSDTFLAQLGFVWKLRVFLEIVKACINCRGNPG
ncbi:MAG TPA: hypothetical protein VKB53_02310 [Gammaproteobacteria bacterium]|jgi:hypothetical protein|nr:hypothetical protein [Gammaproteobacteria bacterium]